MTVGEKLHWRRNNEGSIEVEKKKLSVFNKIKTSIFDFEGYEDLAAEKVSKTIVYIVLLMLIFGILISIAYTFQFSQIINEAKSYVDGEISEINYENNELSIKFNNGQEIAQIDSNNLLADKVIINTTSDEEKIKKSIAEIELEEKGILILKDKVLIKTNISTNNMEYSYKDISEKYNINKVNKDEIISILSGEQKQIFMASLFIAMFVYMFIIYFSSVLVDILLLALLAYIVTKIAGLRLKYSAIYNIAAYSLTLSIILNMIYVMVNIFTGYTIKYFQIMYTTIASIYIITAILIIKSNVIKKQLELNKIIEEQERVKQELKQKEDTEKQQEEQGKREREKQEKKEKEKSENEGEGTPVSEPEGDNA